MDERYFQPWVGNNFSDTRTLLMSESTYNWLGDEGEVETPQPTHPEGSIHWNIENFGKNRYFTQVNRAICGRANPGADEMLTAWQDFAYTVFVQESVGFGAGVRPTKSQWQCAGPHFLQLIEELRPLKVIVTGKDMWDIMPECSVRLLNDIQAYKLKDDSLVWCLALPHPANRTDGFPWQGIGESIRVFRKTSFPADLASLAAL